MTRRMLIEATHPEETRVVVVDGKKLEELDYESATKRQLKGNIYLAKVTRVEPSLQAAFVEYGGNRHGFLAFSEVHPDYYRVPVEDRDAILAEHAAMQAAEDRSADGEEDLANNLRSDVGEPRESRSPADSASPDEAPASSEEAAVLLASYSESLAGPLFESDATHGEHAGDPGETPMETAPGEPHEEAPADHKAHDERHDDTTATEGQQASRPAGRRDAIETVGGDDAEEMRRRPNRPHRRYKIQEVIKRRQIMLVQVTKEERGNKGAALTTYLSLAGRYCVLMPNTGRGGGISRKITSLGDRKRLKSILEEFGIPDGMAVIVRTAGSERNKTELRRDYEYLLRLWDEIRAHTLSSTAPALIYEEASLIKRAIRDLYARDIEEVLVEGEEAYKAAKNFMRMLMPSHAKRVQLYKDPAVHLLQRHQVEGQLDAIHNPAVHLKSGGYIVINSTEALVAIDVNSGRATRERNIEETALRTNLEAADEVARQLRLRDLAGLIVIDFIDMEESRNNSAVERRLKEAMRNDRARIQVGRISAFGLLELSRQRLRPSLIEASTEICRHCRGTGHVRSTESTALHVLRAIEEESARARGSLLTVSVPSSVALYVLNNKRAALAELENRHLVGVVLAGDDGLIPPDHRIERSRTPVPGIELRQPVSQTEVQPEEPEEIESDDEEQEMIAAPPAPEQPLEGRRRPRRRRRRRDESRQGPQSVPVLSHAEAPTIASEAGATEFPAEPGPRHDSAQGGRPDNGTAPGEEGGQRRRRRRGRRGGRRRRRGENGGEPMMGGAVNVGGSADAHVEPDSQSGRDPDPTNRSERSEAVQQEPSGYRADSELVGGSRIESEHHRPAPPSRSDEPAQELAHHRYQPEQGFTDAPVVGDTESARSSPPRRGWWKRLVE
ncbi:MAG: ribonuclease E/G [Dongiaceae bacterium]